MSVIGNVGGSDGLTNDQLRAAPVPITAPSAIPISAASAIPVSGAGGIRVSGNVAASTSGSGTLYTVPAGSYALVQICIAASSSDLGKFGRTSGSASVSIGGVPIASLNAADGTTQSLSYTGAGFYVGPGASITVSCSGTGVAYVSGVVFTNS